MSSSISVRRVALVLSAALLTGTAVYYVTSPDRTVERASAQAVLSPPSQGSTPAASAATTTATRSEPARRSAALPSTVPVDTPTQLSIPSIDVEMKVVPVGVTAEGDMSIPDDVQVAGWYRYGSDPAADEGAVVIAAHVDAANVGAGPLAKLHETKPDEVITLQTERGRFSYRVESTTRFDKDALDLSLVFDRAGPARLHLITCGGAFDRKTRHYEDNVVVVAQRI